MTKVRSLGIILANDLQNVSSALNLVKDIDAQLDGVKLGLHLIIEGGKEVVKKIRMVTDKPLIADFKTADIGFRRGESWSGTNSKIVEKTVELGFDYMTFHVFPGISSTIELISTAKRSGIKTLAIPYLTARGAKLFFGQRLDMRYASEVLEKSGLDRNLVDKCETISDLMLAICESLDVDGYIGPANQPEILSRYRHFTDKPIFCTGIGRQSRGESIKEQLQKLYSICGAECAAIVGSSIYGSQNPIEASTEIARLRDMVLDEA